jgi:hypothetical protein
MCCDGLALALYTLRIRVSDHKTRSDPVTDPVTRVDIAAVRLHSTVHTRQGKFTGFIQWDRQDWMVLSGTREVGDGNRAVVPGAPW